ncbi:MAG TPA: hypothetical protein VGF55_03575 [Gemmataceae bacterium]|jgi:hypothetical protein
MDKDEHKPSDAGVQVFELTMDNTEDQDELNRRLRKPGEPERFPPAKAGRTAQGESPAETPGQNNATP